MGSFTVTCGYEGFEASNKKTKMKRLCVFPYLHENGERESVMMKEE